MAELLRMEGITKQFGAVYANRISICLLKKAKSIHFWVKMVQEKVP